MQQLHIKRSGEQEVTSWFRSHAWHEDHVSVDSANHELISFSVYQTIFHRSHPIFRYTSIQHFLFCICTGIIFSCIVNSYPFSSAYVSPQSPSVTLTSPILVLLPLLLCWAFSRISFFLTTFFFPTRRTEQNHSLHIVLNSFVIVDVVRVVCRGARINVCCCSVVVHHSTLSQCVPLNVPYCTQKSGENSSLTSELNSFFFFVLFFFCFH